MTVSHGKPYAGNLHVRFDEGADVPDEGRSALLHQLNGRDVDPALVFRADGAISVFTLRVK